MSFNSKQRYFSQVTYATYIMLKSTFKVLYVFMSSFDLYTIASEIMGEAIFITTILQMRKPRLSLVK